MSSNLKAIAQQAFRRANHDPSPTEDAVDDMYSFINEAVQQLSLDAPIMFFEDRLPIHTDPDQVCATDVATDRVLLVAETTGPFAGSYNPWLFRVQLPVSTDGTATTDQGQVQWVTGGLAAVDSPPKQWAGRYIDITTEDGNVVTNQIRSVWLEEVTTGGHTYVFASFTVVTPWLYEIFGEGPFEYRVYTNDYYLPDDVIETKSIRVIGNTYTQPLTIIGQREAEEAGYANERAETAGAPRLAFRGDHFQMPSPNVAASISVSALPWLGPEPPGTFEYVYTYCWGRRRDYNAGIALWETQAEEWRETTSTAALEVDRAATMRKREPIWESAPSPVSAVATVAAPGVEVASAAFAVSVLLPNIEYHLGFLLSGLTSDPAPSTAFRRLNVAHSGWHIRVYRRRKTANFTNYTRLGVNYDGQHVPYLQKMDIHDAFYLIGEARLDEYNDGKFIDNGTILPDMSRRLRDINGYQGIRFWPRPDDEYDLEVRCIRRPERLVSASDVPPVHPEAIKLIVDYSAALLYEKLGEPGMAAARMADYQRNLSTLTKRYGDLRPNNTPIPKQLARAYGYNRLVPWRRPRGTE